ncbi:hypothetical protein V492_06662 [Pseudogymnoascus sp. VKM F-4246]|nr:hypothetical protein V492_06662 [Pseudogymnoascus sp. VKM F-4246]
MVSFIQIAALATAFASISSALVTRDPSIVEGRGQTGTSCCVAGTGCTTVSGTAPTGQKWEYCWYSGNNKYGVAEAVVTGCLTRLHASQNSACISADGSGCADNSLSVVQVARSTFLWGNYQLSEDDKQAIFAAGNAAEAAGVMFSLDGGHSIVFSHVADNGAGINGIEMYGSDFKC